MKIHSSKVTLTKEEVGEAVAAWIKDKLLSWQAKAVTVADIKRTKEKEFVIKYSVEMMTKEEMDAPEIPM